MNRVLVTGATGFVGSHLLEALHERGDVQIIAACRDPSRLPELSGIELRVGDLRDDSYLERVVESVDVVCHAAAWTALFAQAERSSACFLQPSLGLLRAARDRGVGRFVFVSTTSAAAPEASADPMSPGVQRPFWPHLCNVVQIEDQLRELAGEGFCTVSMRLGLFAGRRYGLGLLPVLLPRLKTHLVPWVAGGRTGMPIIDGRDIGQAMALAATMEGLSGYQGFNAVGPEVPSVREVIDYLQRSHGYPAPHFGVPFALAYPFAWLMERLDPILPWDPLVTRSIVHLLEETGVDNGRAQRMLGYAPQYHWKEAVDAQLEEMSQRRGNPMPLHVPMS